MIFKEVTSVSGGRTSAYLAAHYPADYLLFALVRIEDEECRFKDEIIRKEVEDRIQKPFIATAEDDMIIYTMLDLEQYLGKKINWVTGDTYERVIYERRQTAVYLPNKISRFCTDELKLKPMFEWWQTNIGDPVIMNIGYRSSTKEIERANKMLSKLNPDGLLEYKTVVGEHPNGDRKWASIGWQRPQFKLIEDGIGKPVITKYWNSLPVRFAQYNNCIGCFERSAMFLKYMYQKHPTKMNWFEKQEAPGRRWKSEVSYSQIKKHKTQLMLIPEDFSECDSGHCEIN
jgi:hypothetical protein